MSKLRIGIDVSQIVYETGVSVYTKNLVENLLKIDSENEYVLFGGALRRVSSIKYQVSSIASKLTKEQLNFKTRIFPIPPTLANILWNKLHILPIETFTGRLDVFHASDWTCPPSSAFKVTTIHDLVPKIYPETTRKDILRNIVSVHLSRFVWVSKEVDRIIAVSLSTKADIVNYLKIPEEKIRVVYEAPNPIFSVKSEAELDRVKRKYEIHGDYFLAVGTGPRKNLDRVVKAFEQLKPKINAKLVVAGRGTVLEGRGIIHISDSSNDELACLYTGAQALVYPSLYEGFGLPILEAFSCGCPVVTSDISSMPEVAGGAAVLVDPRDTESIIEGIKQAARSRDQLVKKGFARAKDFSWEKCAKETLEIYRESQG